jgi:hypothetical protein
MKEREKEHENKPRKNGKRTNERKKRKTGRKKIRVK